MLNDERDVAGLRARMDEPGETLHAPHLIDVEVVSAIRRKRLRDELSPERAGAALSLLDRLRLNRYPHPPLLPRAWELRDALTVYDAVYVALAELLDAPLLTLDGGLASVSGTAATIEHMSGHGSR